MTRHIAPAETRPARLSALAKLPIFLDLAGRRCRGRRRRRRRWPGRPSSLAAAGAEVDRLARRARARAARARRRRRRALDLVPRAPGGPSRSRRRRGGGRRGGRRGGGALRRRGARPRRPRQRHRPAGLLRLPVRRHRQPLARHRVDLDRRRRPGPRPGRSAAASRPSCRMPSRGWGATAKGFRDRLAAHPALEGRPPPLLGKVRRRRLHLAGRGGRAPGRARAHSPSRSSTATPSGPARWSSSAPGPAIPSS